MDEFRLERTLLTWIFRQGRRHVNEHSIYHALKDGGQARIKYELAVWLTEQGYLPKSYPDSFNVLKGCLF